jgi:hypothetical protein
MLRLAWPLFLSSFFPFLPFRFSGQVLFTPFFLRATNDGGNKKVGVGVCFFYITIYGISGVGLA